MRYKLSSVARFLHMRRARETSAAIDVWLCATSSVYSSPCLQNSSLVQALDPVDSLFYPLGDEDHMDVVK